jgi:exopolyphosphatase/guanosine-5'-triphosphate,3'-diphosphate pyrophosphatase
MASNYSDQGARVCAFIDIGTNSIRLLLVRLNPNGSFTTITDQKEVIRLGEDEFVTQRLRLDAMQRAVLVCRKFAELARWHGAQEIDAVATSATREAKNQDEFLKRIQHEAGLDVRVVSGMEEARLVYLGVSSGVHLADRTAVFIDIGGGSTEIIFGNQRQYHYLNSLQLGAIRLTSLLLPDHGGPVSPRKYRKLQLYVRQNAVYAMREAEKYQLDLALGSSGTIENLAQIAARALVNGETRSDDVLRHSDLRQVVALLRSLPLEERRNVPGINPYRADIIIAGAAILDTLMEDMHLPEIVVSKRGLRDGMFVDYLSRTEHSYLVETTSVRRRSVLQLGRASGFEEDHAQRIAQLALEIFDSAREEGLHQLGEWERELLEYAALLHDIGGFLSYSNQPQHTYYIIRNADLLGFDQREVTIMAMAARFHRRQRPRRKKHPEYRALGKRVRRIVRILSLCLSLAESLDRSHAGLVEHARLRAHDRKVTLHLACSGDCQLEIWGVRNHQKAVAKVFKRKLELEVLNAGDSCPMDTSPR